MHSQQQAGNIPDSKIPAPWTISASNCDNWGSPCPSWGRVHLWNSHTSAWIATCPPLPNSHCRLQLINAYFLGCRRRSPPFVPPGGRRSWNLAPKPPAAKHNKKTSTFLIERPTVQAKKRYIHSAGPRPGLAPGREAVESLIGQCRTKNTKIRSLAPVTRRRSNPHHATIKNDLGGLPALITHTGYPGESDSM